MEPSNPPEAEMEALRIELRDAMSRLRSAENGALVRGFLGVTSAVLSCMGMVFGLGMAVCTFQTTLLGIAVTVTCTIFLLWSLRLYSVRVLAQDESDRGLVKIGGRIVGSEGLRVSHNDLNNLHKRLYTADPKLAVQILNILAAVGNSGSLHVARNLAGDEIEGSMLAGGRDLFACGHDQEAQKAAARAIVRIQERLKQSQQSNVLLRPAATPADQGLLRPAASSTESHVEQLLRPHPFEDVDSSGNAD